MSYFAGENRLPEAAIKFGLITVALHTDEQMVERPIHKTRPEQESRLLEALAGGSEAAFKTLYDWYQPRLLRAVLPFAATDQDAEEAVQEVFFKLWARRETMLGIESLRHYLSRMARNQLLDLQRKETIEHKYRNRIPVNGKQPATAEEDATFKEYIQVACEAIDQLPQRQKTVFLLRHCEDRTIYEIAAATGSTKMAVNKNLNRAVVFIKEYLRTHSEWFAVFLFYLLDQKR